MTDQAEQIARALAPYLEGGREFDQMPNNKEAKRAWHRANMCSVNDATKEDALDAARAVLPFIAAERERCAVIADEHATMWRDRARKDREKGRDDALAAMAAAEVKRTAAAIRSQP